MHLHQVHLVNLTLLVQVDLSQVDQEASKSYLEVMNLETHSAQGKK